MSPRPPDVRDVVARALMDYAVSVNPGIANFAEGVLPYVYEPQADAVLDALRQSGHLAPATPGDARPAGTRPAADVYDDVARALAAKRAELGVGGDADPTYFDMRMTEAAFDVLRRAGWLDGRLAGRPEADQTEGETP